MNYSEVKTLLYQSEEIQDIPDKWVESVPIRCETNGSEHIAFLYWNPVGTKAELKRLLGIRRDNGEIIVLNDAKLKTQYGLEQLTFSMPIYGRCAASKEVHHGYAPVQESQESWRASEVLCRERQSCHRQQRNLCRSTRIAKIPSEEYEREENQLSSERHASLSRLRSDVSQTACQRESLLDVLRQSFRCHDLLQPEDVRIRCV